MAILPTALAKWLVPVLRERNEVKAPHSISLGPPAHCVGTQTINRKRLDAQRNTRRRRRMTP
jgi:hypothetical protein